MKEPYIEGVANHDDPESCAERREVPRRSVDRGTSGLGIEPRNQPVQGAEAVNSCRRPHARERHRELPGGPARSETPCTLGSFPHGNREIHASPSRDGRLGRIGKAEGLTPVMHDARKSDEVVVPEKLSNNAGYPAAEAMEGRTAAKRNMDQQNACRTQSRGYGAPNALDRVRCFAKSDRGAKITALLHHVTVERLRSAFLRLHKQAAAGVDGVTWKQYAEHLDTNVVELHSRLHRGAYRTRPSRRVFIPKPDGQKRPLGIAALEDKLVQSAVSDVMNAIYEVEFLGFSYGFRPGRGQHDALDALYTGLMRRKVRYVLDADIRGFFDAIDHGWMLKFVEHRIADRRILRLIQKWLSAGVTEEGVWSETKQGTPQGATISPLLANVYLHYVFDLWAQQWRSRKARGDVVIVRYADDTVVGFQYHADAVQFLGELRERLRKFALELHPDKTRLIEFGTLMAERRRESGLKGRLGTFNFLGFTHITARTRNGKHILLRRTRRDRLRATLSRVRGELMRRRHLPIPTQGAWLGSVVRGYFAYHAVPTNVHTLQAFRTQVERHWKHALSRRSQRGRPNWETMRKLSARWLPKPRILHPWPEDRFNAKTQGRSRVR